LLLILSPVNVSTQLQTSSVQTQTQGLKLEIYFECKFGICNSPPLPTYLPPLSQPLSHKQKSCILIFLNLN